MVSSGLGPFDAHIDLLQFFVGQRLAIVGRIEAVLNAQRKPTDYLQDGPLLSRHLEDCFFDLTGLNHSQLRLRGQLEEAHRAAGFRPREISGLHNGLIDPAEMMIRGFHLWQQTRWPGRNGRVRYALTLFNLYLLRCLELLSMRLWDAEPPGAGARLAQVQAVLDQLWNSSPPDHPVLVRDARWLMQLAQSPATDDLGAYFDVAARIAATLPQADRMAIHKAGVRMAGGHLRSQIRHYSRAKALPLDDRGLVLSTRNSNALDFALLIQDLVPLLEAYELACRDADRRQRLDLAGAICQGVSPDPELFLNRLDLLAAYSMLEDLFITTDRDGHAAYTPMGQRHVQLLEEYDARLARVSKPLLDDCQHFTPVDGAYSPYGVIYGFSSDLIEHMALKTLQPDAVNDFSLEDVFADAGVSGDRLAWVSGWRKLPHLAPEVEKLFAYPQQFAEDIFRRIQRELRARDTADGTKAVVQTGRLFVVPDDDSPPGATASLMPALPVRYIRSSDPRLVAAHKAESCGESQLLSDRREGKWLLSYQTAGGWVAITKDILTDVLGAGDDRTIAGLPREAAAVLKLMAPRLAVLPADVDHARPAGRVS